MYTFYYLKQKPHVNKSEANGSEDTLISSICQKLWVGHRIKGAGSLWRFRPIT